MYMYHLWKQKNNSFYITYVLSDAKALTGYINKYPFNENDILQTSIQKVPQTWDISFTNDTSISGMLLLFYLMATSFKQERKEK